MDLLYSKYASPMEFMKMYIDQGRFGEFVQNIVEIENKRKQEEAELASDNRLWIAYVHSMSEQSFVEWKEGLKQQAKEQSNKPVSYSMNNEQVADVKAKARGILKTISPK